MPFLLQQVSNNLSVLLKFLHSFPLGSINLNTAYMLYEDLKKAQNKLILVDYLHLLYLVTPYDIAKQISVIGHVYYDVVSKK